MKHFLISTLLFLSFSAKSQQYKIEVELPNAANKEIQLTYHFLEKIYSQDTILLDNQGKGIFEGDSLLPQGLYKILIDKDSHFDFLLGADQQFHLYNESNETKEMRITGSAESEGFVDYINFLDELREENQRLTQNFQNATPDEKVVIQEKRIALDIEMKAYWDNVITKMPGSFLYAFMVANYVPALDINTLPESVQKNDSLLLLERFNYQRDHFWDYFDYTDERMLYTPFYKAKLDTWFNKVLYPAYDSAKPYVYEFLNDVEHNPRIFQFATSFLISASLYSKIIGMDALFVDLANDYYFSGKAFWATDETMENIRENVLFHKDNLIGKTAPDLMLETFDGEHVALHQIDAKITVLIIYEPNCGHCKVFVPKFHDEVYQQYKEKGLEVFAIYSMDDKEEWAEFLTKHNLFDWINVWDEDHISRFKILYDGRVTPGIYVLDSNKMIISKGIDHEQLKTMMKKHLN